MADDWYIDIHQSPNKMKSSAHFVVIFLLSILGSPQVVFAQAESPIQTIPQLTDSIESLMDKHHIPGLLLTLVSRDSILYEGGLGWANIEEERPVDKAQLFRMGSISKSFAALLLLKLEAEGKLSLQDKLKDIAPEVPFTNPWESTHPVRIVNLLEHTAGFDDMHFAAMYNRTEQELPTLEMVKKHQKSLTSRWPPSTRMAYSNPCFVIAAYLIEKFSGMSYHDYVRQEIFDPLGMKYSNFRSFKEDEQKYAQGYSYSMGAYESVPFYAINGAIAGTLNSSSHDMARFVQFFLNHGKIDSVSLFSPAQIDRMERPTTTLAAQRGLADGYGLANTISNLSAKVPFHGHGGGIDGFSSYYAYNRDIGMGFAISNNANGSNRAIIKLIIDFLTKDANRASPKSQAIRKEELAPYLGFYNFRSPRNQVFYGLEKLATGSRLAFEHDTLYLSNFMGANKTALIHTGNFTFKEKGHNRASHILMKDQEGNLVYSNLGNYYVPGSMPLRISSLIILSFCSLISSTFALVGLVLLILYKVKQLSAFNARNVLPNFIGSLAFILAYTFFILATLDLVELGTLNIRTASFTFFSWLAAVGSVLGLVMVWVNFAKFSSRLFAWYLLLVGLAQVYLVYFLWQIGLLGLRLWVY